MSRAFVREDDTFSSPVPDRPVSSSRNLVTARGLAALRARLQAIMRQIDTLMQQPDTAERALAVEPLRREQRYLTQRIESAQVVTPAVQPLRVGFGCRIEISDVDGRHWLEIVGEDEADAAVGRIAWTAPLARALFGAVVGDVVIWQRPAGVREVEVLAVTGS